MDRQKIMVRTHGNPQNAGPVVVLHGGPGAPGSALGLARELGRRFYVLEPLQRIAGETPLTVERHVRDLLEVLPPKAVIVGWSWGAMLGLSFAARHPDRLAALVLVGCGTYDRKTREIFQQRVIERLDENQRKRLLELERELRSSVDDEHKNRALEQLGRIISRASIHAGLEDGTANDLPVDHLGHAQIWDDVLRLQEEGIEPQIFTAMRVPVLMVHGAEDPHPGRETSDLLRHYIPDLEYHELARCGHEPWREKYAKEAFLNLVSEWIARYAQGPQAE